jgi:hypothetical protein
VKKLPEPDLPGAGSSFVLVAGARYEVQQRKRGREMEVIRVRFKVKGSTLVPAGAASAGDLGRASARSARINGA